MPNPKEVFEHPDRFWEFLTAKIDSDFEGQHFDRKEACRQNPDGSVSGSQISGLQDHITETISAFANENKEGGLLVLGISRVGKVEGIEHLSERQLNSLLAFNNLLLHQSAVAKIEDCLDEDGSPKKVCLIHVPCTERYICETHGASPKSWFRQNAQNLPLNDFHKERLRRDKGIVNYEGTYCCSYDPAELDQDVVNEFRRTFLQDAGFEYSIEEMLYHAGALIKVNSGLAFTNAGFLFFASNPQRVLPASVIRLLRFEVNHDQTDARGLPTFDKSFSGPITKQVRNIRTFFRESAFFKMFQRRGPEGGFIEEPEYPFVATDESIVNAVAHRDYAMTFPIRCESYKDAFVVVNPGRIQQINHDVPDQFSLETVRLESAPRNPSLIRWLRTMRDERGSPFVRELGEGTASMRIAMAALNLSAPVYRVSNAQTTVLLFNNADERAGQRHAEDVGEPTEFANLFPLKFVFQGATLLTAENLENRKRDLMASLKDALTAKGWYLDSFKFSRLIAHRRGVGIPLPGKVEEVVRFFPSYVFQVRQYFNHYYLCIDYKLEVKSVRYLHSLLVHFGADELAGKSATVNWNGWQRAKILSANHEWARVYFYDFDQEERVPSDKVIPQIPRAMIERLLQAEKIRFDLNQAIKQHSLATEPSASRIRLDNTQAIAESVAENIFPLRFDGTRVTLSPSPAPLFRPVAGKRVFRVYSLPEPSVEFGHGQAEADIRDGITKFGAYSDSPKTVELIPICTAELRDMMAGLIERLKVGKYKYRGSERTFYTRFTYNSILTVPQDKILSECKRLLGEHPEWAGNQQLSRLFLVYTPEKGYALDDENAPYYVIKRYLLEHGIPCQMLDMPTLMSPDWKDLNLALNIVGKCGVTPWVLPDAIPDADFFVGLSFTENLRKGSERLMGYANVFNHYGRWEFYSGSTETFSYDERALYFQKLVRQTLERLPLSETPSIHFHYSAKFSREDRLAILDAARSVRPQGTYSFVWINTQHNVRLYDTRAETNGSLSRGSYVVTSPNQMYLSTTGYNPYRKTLGTPDMLEINVRTERPAGIPPSPPDLKSFAVHALSLTKLNWASTDSLCAEPITIKYAGRIAYLTSAFLRQGGAFQLHPVLEKTPWFL
jgi:predicted HTH transcriptional regulator